MARQYIRRTTVIVAFDINSDERRKEFRSFITDELDGTAKTETVYEFVLGLCDLELKDIIGKINDIINKTSDTVYIWNMDKHKEKNTIELWSTKLGK